MVTALLTALSAAYLGVVPGCLIDSPPRQDASVRAFRTKWPCPATGKKTGACPGWEINHIVPLCCGGADHSSNMVWLTVEQHKAFHKAMICKGSKP